MSDNKPLLGRPIEGYKREAYVPAEQEPIEDLVEALDKLLATDGVKAVRWQQYTPHFNDGDACIFSAYEASVALSFVKPGDLPDDEELIDYDEEYDEDWDHFLDDYSLYDYALPYGHEDRYEEKNKVFQVKGRDTKEIHDNLVALNRRLERGAHDKDLQEYFGDHCVVTATPEGFSIDEYSHD